MDRHRRLRIYLAVVIALAMGWWLLVACGGNSSGQAIVVTGEDKEAKRLLQGIWVDAETENVSFMMRGDTIFYPDTTSMPAYFKVVADTLCVGGHHEVKYLIEKHTEHLFWFRNQNGDFVKLAKSENAADSLYFSRRTPDPVIVSQLVKKDTVVTYQSERYHCYVTINPTDYKVITTSYNDAGMAMSNVFYDNIVHLSVYQGNRKLFSSNVDKHAFNRYVPTAFLEHSVLGNVCFAKVDNRGFHFEARVTTPDNPNSYYLLDLTVSHEGKLAISLN